ncbi:putative pH-response regulator protein palF/rim-8 [Podospora conica]|nr:putative pH-response regulator protein palF/rim-8 [Schizothecium conicum]
MGPYQKSDPSAAASASASASASAPSSSTASVVVEGAPSRSFFSRFALPLRSRARHVADFHIRPSDPHRTYRAGEHVQGAVILAIVKPVRITHLTVALHGYARVSKTPSAPSAEPINPAEVPMGAGRSARLKSSGGYASLFQDEQVLSSDGRLEPGRYEFNFDLLFPSKGLPSSIDFERGTISYLITATLTRPTSIAPTMICERKIYLVERLDIGSVIVPRSRTIYLEPISKRTKKKRQTGAERESSSTSNTSATPEPASDLDSTRANENSTEGSLSIIGEDLGQDAINNPRSPGTQYDMRSVSGDSAGTASTGPTRAVEVTLTGTSGAQSGAKIGPAVRNRTITATIELLRGGCLAGDMVPVRISVQHIRRIKSMHGVIITLYRQGRIDSAPPLPLSRELTKREAKRLEKEEYYPKSKTGLGGLSLSSAGSCSVFRKDLSQVFAPLIIDPATLTASVTTSIRIPEDVFPTIKGVPYEMITFKYNIEVIVDLGGKLANQIQTSKMGPGAAPFVGNPYEAGAASLASWSTSIIDTDRLRREKGVICVVDEVVVGTLDSSRLRGKSVKPSPSTRSQPYTPDQRTPSHGPGWPHPVAETDQDLESYPEEEYSPYPEAAPHHHYWHIPPTPAVSAPHYIPPPDPLPDDRTLTEKDRIRQAEQRLLPSQPPIAGASSAAPGDEENIYDADDQPPDAPPPLVPPDEPSAPSLDDLAPPPPHGTEDKQELERRRLLAEASAPPEFPEDYDDNNGESSASAAGPSAPPLEEGPSAPVLGEDEEQSYGMGYAYGSAVTPGVIPEEGGREPLPRYER